MEKVYKASRLSEGNKLFPDQITITDEFFMFKKGKLIGGDEVKIKKSSVGSVSVSKHLLFADITIETTGGMKIVANGFSKSDADEIAAGLTVQ